MVGQRYCCHVTVEWIFMKMAVWRYWRLRYHTRWIILWRINWMIVIRILSCWWKLIVCIDSMFDIITWKMYFIIWILLKIGFNYLIVIEDGFNYCMFWRLIKCMFSWMLDDVIYYVRIDYTRRYYYILGFWVVIWCVLGELFYDALFFALSKELWMAIFTILVNGKLIFIFNLDLRICGWF